MIVKELSALMGVKQDAIYMRLHRNKERFIQQVKELQNGND